MMTPLLRTTAWVGFVDALAVAACLAFLYTPESNVLMLGVSALTLLVAGLLLAIGSASAADGLVQVRRPWTSVGAAMRHLPLVAYVVIVVGLICAAAGWFESWWLAHAGEVDAAAIAAGDVTRTGGLHAAARGFVVAVQWVLVPAWLATALAWIAGYDTRDVLTLKWLTAGLHWRVLLVTAIGVGALVWLPWRVAYWRPAALPATVLEPAFVVLKVVVLYVLSQLAWAATLWAAATRVTPSVAAPEAPVPLAPTAAPTGDAG